jgi:hypothetical protein
MSCIKELATLEPLVDIVPPDQIVTDYCCIKDIDTTVCTAADLNFSAPFTLTASRDDYVHGTKRLLLSCTHHLPTAHHIAWRLQRS